MFGWLRRLFRRGSVTGPTGPVIDMVRAREIEGIKSNTRGTVVTTRCQSRKREGSRSWRCVVEGAHRVHHNRGGDRKWT